MVTNLSFDVDGIHYCLMTFDTTLTVDELFDMAEELMLASGDLNHSASGYFDQIASTEISHSEQLFWI